MTLETKDTFHIVRGVQHKHEHAARRACLDNAGYNMLDDNLQCAVCARRVALTAPVREEKDVGEVLHMISHFKKNHCFTTSMCIARLPHVATESVWVWRRGVHKTCIGEG